MIANVIRLAVLALVLLLVGWLVGVVVAAAGLPWFVAQVVWVILALVFIWYLLQAFGLDVWPPGRP